MKLTLAAPPGEPITVELLRSLGFCRAGTRVLRGQQVTEFYLDLYRVPRPVRERPTVSP